MEWVLFALIAPVFWTISNFLDKYAIEKVTKGIADYAFFGSIGPIVVLTFLPLFFDIHIPSSLVLVVTLFAGFLLNYTYLNYGITLAYADASRVVPIFQFRVVIILIIGSLFFGEVLTLPQLLGFLVALLGVMILSIDFNHLRTPRLNKWTLLALVATFFFAIITLLNDFSVENLDIPSVIFFFDAGFLLASISYLLFPVWRSQIIEGLKATTWRKVVLFSVNDAADELGQLFSKLALASAPAAALVAVVQGIQSLYVLVGGIVLTIWFPAVTKEDISKRKLVQKFGGAIIIFIGIAMMQLL